MLLEEATGLCGCHPLPCPTEPQPQHHVPHTPHSHQWKKTPRYLGNFGKFEGRTTPGISKRAQGTAGAGAAVIDPSFGTSQGPPQGASRDLQEQPGREEGEEEEEISDSNLPALTLTKSKFPSQGHGQNQELSGRNEENQLSPRRGAGLVSRGDGSVSDVFGASPQKALAGQRVGQYSQPLFGLSFEEELQFPSSAGSQEFLLHRCPSVLGHNAGLCHTGIEGEVVNSWRLWEDGWEVWEPRGSSGTNGPGEKP
ncbi:uncharacterized protein LOC130252389 isoform X2 [Oenanthe melanoleuca]|uniref:uncharacterized protein LOC130252389 isoform X2 n=1 Tax=Oenanthe melanoleuca TaxID=2939378 RepID=UPI0024C14BDE|nr:uncharacterized protein LOC130252389 isoform X2 [Oenanthe melanoleuca]